MFSFYFICWYKSERICKKQLYWILIYGHFQLSASLFDLHLLCIFQHTEQNHDDSLAAAAGVSAP